MKKRVTYKKTLQDYTIDEVKNLPMKKVLGLIWDDFKSTLRKQNVKKKKGARRKAKTVKKIALKNREIILAEQTTADILADKLITKIKARFH